MRLCHEEAAENTLARPRTSVLFFGQNREAEEGLLFAAQSFVAENTFKVGVQISFKFEIN